MIQIHHQQLERMIWGCWKFDFWSTSSPDHLLPHCPPSARLLTVFNLNADFRIPLIYGFTISDSINNNHLLILDIPSREILMEYICNHFYQLKIWIILTFSPHWYEFYWYLNPNIIKKSPGNWFFLQKSADNYLDRKEPQSVYTLCRFVLLLCLSVFSKL